MCTTRYISALFAAASTRAPAYNILQVSMKRSDGELFTANVTLLTEGEADKVKKLLNYFEELRTCECKKDAVCSKHSSLEKKQ